MLLPDLRARATDPELLDAVLPASEVRKSLADLRLVNRWLSGRGGLRRAVAPHLPPRGRLLDVGCGSGDVLGHLCAGLAEPPLAVGVDVKPLHLRETPALVRRVAADVAAAPLRRRGASTSSPRRLFLHHFDAAELGQLHRASSAGWRGARSW